MFEGKHFFPAKIAIAINLILAEDVDLEQKVAGLDHFGQIAMRRAKHADIDRECFVFAHPADLAAFEKP